MRVFRDDSGEQWEVYEVSSESMRLGRAALLPAAYRGGWLVFQSLSERRRLAPVPAEWQSFSAAALGSMLRRAERFPLRDGGRTKPQTDETPFL